MLRYFKGRHPGLYISLLFYAFILNGVHYFKAPPEYAEIHSYIFKVLNYDKLEVPAWLLVTFSILLAYSQALLTSSIINKYRLIKDVSLLPAFIFITLGAIFPGIILFSPAILSLYIMLYIINQLLKLFDLELAVEVLFFISFHVGICALFYSPLAFFILLVFIATPILKRPSWWEFAIIPFGFLIPLYVTGFIYYLADDFDVYRDAFLTSFPVISLKQPGQILPFIIPVAYLGIILVTGFLQYSFQAGSKVVRESRYQRLFLTYFLITVFLLVFTTAQKYFLGYMLIIPVTLFISYIFSLGNKKIYDLAYLGMLLILILMQWHYLDPGVF